MSGGEPGPLLTESVGEYIAGRAAQLHRRVDVDPTLKGQTICIRPGANTPEQLDSLVATALDASWVKENSAWRFTRTRTDQKALLDRHRELGKQWLNARFAEYEKEIADAKAFGSASAQFLHYAHLDAEAIRANRISHLNDHRRPAWPIDFAPAGRLVYRLVRQLEIEKLAEATSERPVVFCNSPTGTELPIPNAKDALAEFVAEQRKFVLDTSSQTVAADLRDSFNSDRIGSNVVPDAEQLKVLLTEWRGADVIGFVMKVYGPDGAIVANTFFESKTGAGNYTTLAKEASSVDSQSGESLVTLGEASQNYLGLTTRLPQFDHPPLAGSFSASVPSDDLVRALPRCTTNPEEVDPNRFVLPEMVEAMSGTLAARPMVALLTDGLWQIAPWCLVEKQASGAKFKAMLSRGGSALVDTKEGLVLRPIDPLEASYVERARLGAATRLILADRRLTVRNWSLLSSSLVKGENNPLLDHLNLALHYVGYPESGFQTIAYAHPTVLKLLAQVAPDNFGRASQFAIDPSEPGVQAILWRSLVGPNSPLGKAPSGTDLSLNPTEVFSTGPLRPQVRFVCQPQVLYTLLQKGNPAGGNPYGAPPQAFAPVLFASSNTRDLFDQTVKWLTSQEEFTVRVDSVATYEVQLAMPGGAQFSQPLREVLQSRVLQPKDLSAEFWNAVYDGRQRLKAAQAAPATPVTSPPP